MMKKILVASLCIGLAACSSTGGLQSSDSSGASAASQGAAAHADHATETDAQRASRRSAELAKKSVYFEFDEFSLKPQYQDIVKQDAEFMKAFGRDNVVLEGNADERGSKEYNLALGQKRAETVRKALIMLGVPDARIEAISYGKEKPRATCHEEQCWQENRRVDFAHKSK